MRFVLAAVLCGACGGGAGLSAPPPYNPANSPEAPTSCPKETLAANHAREMSLSDNADAEAAASMVYALAECERRAFDGLDLDTPENTAAITAARAQLSTVKNLYEEVMRSQRPRWVVGALARTGDLYAAYAVKIRHIRQASEAEELAKIVDGDAHAAYVKCLDATDAFPDVARGDMQVTNWIVGACAGAGNAESARYPACKRIY